MKQKELQEKISNLSKGLNILNNYIFTSFDSDNNFIGITMEDNNTISIEDKFELSQLGFKFWSKDRISYRIF